MQDAATWSTLAACRGCQRRIAAEATQQYYDEITKLSQVMMRAAGEGFASLPQRPSAKP
jgi:hypothetical protein